MFPIETPNKQFVDGNGTTELGTILPAWWLNQIQAELLAVLAAAAQEFLDEETMDADLAHLLRGVPALTAYADDPRVTALIRACSELTDAPASGTEQATARRAAYALTAGAEGRTSLDAIASGRTSLSWGAVPPGVFDAAEETVTWSVVPGPDRAPQHAPDPPVVARVQVELATPGLDHPLAAGIAVRLSCGELSAEAALGERGTATLPLALSDSAAWNTDWEPTRVLIGAGAAETREARDRARRLARSRLSRPSADAFVAELLAAESDY